MGSAKRGGVPEGKERWVGWLLLLHKGDDGDTKLKQVKSSHVTLSKDEDDGSFYDNYVTSL